MSHNTSPDYTIFSVCNRYPTEPYYCLDSWLKSVAAFNTLVVASVGTPYTGLCDKVKFLYRAILGGHIKTKYLIACDSWDLVFAADAEEVIETYKCFNADIVVSAERNCFPADLKEQYDQLPSTSSFKYLNSGFIVGTTDAMLAMLEAMEVESIPNDYFDGEKNVHFNDQFEVQKIFLKQPVKMELDYQQILSGTLHSVTMDDLDFSGERIKIKETGSYPCVLHMNGSAKTDGLREPILTHLNLI